MYANKNNLRSELTANVGVLDTSISITAWEWVLRENNMVACLEHVENGVVTKREIIKITAKSTDTFTVTRWFADCIMNDSTKAQGHGSQEFSVWDYLSLYLSKELRESITTWIWTNASAIQTMKTNVTTLKNCIDGCCCNWIAKVGCLNDSHFTNGWFWNASDGDCVMEAWDHFLCADTVYNFRNLTICEWACVRFVWQWVPQIKVYDHYINNGVIDTRAWFQKTCWCSKCIVFWNSWTVCDNNKDNACITPYKGWWVGSGWRNNACCWCGWSASAWGDGWMWGCSNCHVRWWPEAWWPADWENGWCGWAWEPQCWKCNEAPWGWGGWGWGGWMFGNGWKWGRWGQWNQTSDYRRAGSNWWQWWNSWLFGCWGCWGDGWWGYWGWQWWAGWCWYIGWMWGRWGSTALNCGMCAWKSWNGWDWIITWWKGWLLWYWGCYTYPQGWNWWNALTNIYWLLINARCVEWSWCIRACGWTWGDGWSMDTACDSWVYFGCWWNGWNGWDWGQVIYAYMHWTPETICVNGWAWGCGWCWGWCRSAKCWVDWSPWTAWTDGWKVVYMVGNDPHIQNFTLWQDEDNETILINWKDPSFLPTNPTQRWKTVVRYSTSNYPATITDWTLAVEETVKNTYESNPFVLSGVLDETTYYFTAFALDVNDTIIDVQSMSITTEFRLPITYQEVEWIWSNWYQYINTWYLPTQTPKIDIDFMFLWWDSNTWCAIYWRRWWNNDWTYNDNFCLYVHTSTLRMTPNYWWFDPWDGSWLTISRNVKYKVVNDAWQFYLDNVLKPTCSTNNRLLRATYPIRLFENDINGSWQWRHTQMRLYSCKMYNDWVIVREFIPCYRKSDSVIWLYDRIWKQFYTNQGSWTFSKGWNV